MDQRIARRRDVPSEHVLVTVASKRFLRPSVEGEPTEMRVLDASIYGAALVVANTELVKPGDDLVIEYEDASGHAVVRNVTPFDSSSSRLGIELADDAKPIFDAIRAATADAA